MGRGGIGQKAWQGWRRPEAAAAGMVRGDRGAAAEGALGGARCGAEPP